MSSKSNNSRSKPSPQQRAAQSKRDKQLAEKRVVPTSGRRLQAKAGRNNGPSRMAPITGFFAPVSEGTIMKSIKPAFERMAHDRQRIVHREKIARLSTPGTGTFTLLGSFPLNPGSPDTFPWLSNEAAGWESYKFNRIRFIWIPTSGTQVAGNIIMAPDYDASDAAPAGETILSSYSDCQEGNIWCRFAADLEKKLLNSTTMSKYVRVGALAANQDIKLYDSGNFFVFSVDDAVVNNGKLWVEYDVELFNPQVPPGGFQSSGTLLGAGGSFSAASPYGAVPVSTGPLSITAAGAVISVRNVEVGQELCFAITVVGTAITTGAWVAPFGLVIKSGGLANNINAAATNVTTMNTYIVTAQNPTLTYSMTAATVTATNVVVTCLAPIPGF